MKTTLEIPDELYRASKTMAAQKGVKLKELFARGLEMALEEEANKSRYPTPSETFAMVREAPVHSAEEIKAMIVQIDRERKEGWESQLFYSTEPAADAPQRRIASLPPQPSGETRYLSP